MMAKNFLLVNQMLEMFQCSRKLDMRMGCKYASEKSYPDSISETSWSTAY